MSVIAPKHKNCPASVSLTLSKTIRIVYDFPPTGISTVVLFLNSSDGSRTVILSDSMLSPAITLNMTMIEYSRDLSRLNPEDQKEILTPIVQWMWVCNGLKFLKLTRRKQHCFTVWTE